MIVGIDPGAEGAIVAITPSKGLLWQKFKDTKGFEYPNNLAEFIDKLTLKDIIYIEKVGSRPNQSSIATFSFGRNLGIVEGMLKQRRLIYHTVLPQEWQHALGLYNITGKATFKNDSVKKAARKKAYVEHAKKLYPSYAKYITADLGDDILIAEYAYLQELKKEDV
jgi:hypothetical protein